MIKLEQIETLPQMFLYSIGRFKKKRRFLQKYQGKYKRITSREFFENTKNLCLGLTSLNVNKADRVAILSYNRVEWAMADYAILCLGAITVPIYTSLSQPQIEFILRDSQSKIIFIENKSYLPLVENIETVERIILIENGQTDSKKVINMQDVINSGSQLPISKFFEICSTVKKDDLATIIYTSGTTGVPKGVMLTHYNFISNILASTKIVPIGKGDTTLSFLPLAHIFERHMDYAAFFRGATIGYAESMEKVAQNLQEVKPTIVAGVPRFFEKIYNQIKENIKNLSPVQKKIFEMAFQVGKEIAKYKFRKRGIPIFIRLAFYVANFLVFKKIKKALGGRIKFFISGGAALPREIGEFLYYLNLPVLEGYGLTETSPVISVNTLKRIKFGTVGKPLPNVEVKIAPDGEILVKGSNVMIGYYNRPEETAMCLRQGWFHTGDIGQIDSEGYLIITDRKKDLFKTSGGKYISPQPIENKFMVSPLVSQAMVIGEGRKFPAVLFFPNFVFLEEFARKHGLKSENRRHLLSHPLIIDEYQKLVDATNQDLSQPEKIKKFLLIEEEPTIASNELTPTMKLRRKIIEQKYRHQIDDLYKE